MFSMPAWADTEGGPFNKEQVTQLVNFIMLWHRRGLGGHRHDPCASRGQPIDRAGSCEIRRHGRPAPRLRRRTASRATASTRMVASTLPTAPNLGRYGVKGPLNDELKRLRRLRRRRTGSSSGSPTRRRSNRASRCRRGSNTEGGALDEQTIRTIVEYLQGLGK